MNIGSTDNIDILRHAEEVRDTIDESLEIAFDDQHASDTEHTHADISKSSDRIGYELTKDIREGVNSFIGWYHANEEWYNPLVREL